jgi:hypothetical protein
VASGSDAFGRQEGPIGTSRTVEVVLFSTEATPCPFAA